LCFFAPCHRYGPFWIASTLIFLLGACGNFATYLDAVVGDTSGTWHYDFTKVTVAAVMVYVYVTVTPILLWAVFKWRDIPIGLLENCALYGYSLLTYIPTAVCVFARRVLCSLGLHPAQLTVVYLPPVAGHDCSQWYHSMDHYHCGVRCGFGLLRAKLPSSSAKSTRHCDSAVGICRSDQCWLGAVAAILLLWFHIIANRCTTATGSCASSSASLRSVIAATKRD
jgi:hypothetical protein